MTLTRAERRVMERHVAKFPAILTEVNRDEWPNYPPSMTLPQRVWRSRFFLVQQYEASGPALCRLSVNRTSLQASTGRWGEDITWQELQDIKREVGFGYCDAVEVFPRDRDVVNVANMRHLWVMAAPVEFAWRKK